MTQKEKAKRKRQRILIFQQNGSGESKIAGLRKYGRDSLVLESISIDHELPGVIDNSADYLPEEKLADPAFYACLLGLELEAGGLSPYRLIARYTQMLGTRTRLS